MSLYSISCICINLYKKSCRKYTFLFNKYGFILQSKKYTVIQNTFVTIHFAAMFSLSSPYSGWHTQGIFIEEIEINLATPIPH